LNFARIICGQGQAQFGDASASADGIDPKLRDESVNLLDEHSLQQL